MKTSFGLRVKSGFCFLLQNSFFAMYLINCCTQLLDLSNDISIVAGVVHR